MYVHSNSLLPSKLFSKESQWFFYFKTKPIHIIYLNMLAHSVTKKDNSFFRKSETWWLQVVCVQGECQLRVLDTLWLLLFKTVRHIMAISINPLRNCMFMSQNLSVYLCNAIHVYGYSFSLLTHRSRVQTKKGVF